MTFLRNPVRPHVGDHIRNLNWEPGDLTSGTLYPKPHRKFRKGNLLQREILSATLSATLLETLSETLPCRQPCRKPCPQSFRAPVLLGTLSKPNREPCWEPYRHPHQEPYQQPYLWQPCEEPEGIQRKAAPGLPRNLHYGWKPQAFSCWGKNLARPAPPREPFQFENLIENCVGNRVGNPIPESNTWGTLWEPFQPCSKPVGNPVVNFVWEPC